MMLRKTQNQDDADDANDAESGIWYRDILKTASLASQASSASLSSRKSSEGVWGTPQKCGCGYPNAMLAKHVYPQNGDNQTRCPYKSVYPQRKSTVDSLKIFNSPEWINNWSTLPTVAKSHLNQAKLSKWITFDSSKNLDSKKWIGSDSRCN